MGNGLDPQDSSFRALRVLHVVSVPGVGGVQVWISQISARLARMGYAQTIACVDEAASITRFAADAEVVPLKVGIAKFAPLGDLRYFIQLVRMMRQGHYDVVNLFAAKAGLYGRLAARIAGIPAVIYHAAGFPFHDFLNPAMRFVLANLERLLSSHCSDAVVCCGEEVRTYALRNRIAPPERLVTIVNGVEIPADLPAREDARRALGLASDAPVAGMVGRLSEQKAPENFLQAAALVIREIPAAQFLIVGDGPMRLELGKLVLQLGIAPNIHFLGMRSDVPVVLRALDVFALFSRWEGLPLTILEAMTAERPVVATAVDGNVEAVQDGKTGLLSPVTDIKLFADHITTLLKDPAQAAAMGRAGRRLVEERFTLDRAVTELSDLYQKLHRDKYPETEADAVNRAAADRVRN